MSILDILGGRLKPLEPPPVGAWVWDGEIYYNGTLVGEVNRNDGRVYGVGGDPDVTARAQEIYEAYREEERLNLSRWREQTVKAARAALGLD